MAATMLLRNATTQRNACATPLRISANPDLSVAEQRVRALSGIPPKLRCTQTQIQAQH
jgi:hypothetical protein